MPELKFYTAPQSDFSTTTLIFGTMHRTTLPNFIFIQFVNADIKTLAATGTATPPVMIAKRAVDVADKTRHSIAPFSIAAITLLGIAVDA